MDVIMDLLPRSIASLIRRQPPEQLMLAGGLILTAIVVVFYRSMRRW